MGSIKHVTESDSEPELSHELEQDILVESDAIEFHENNADLEEHPSEDMLENNIYEEVNNIAQYFLNSLKDAPKTDLYYNEAVAALKSIQKCAVRLSKKVSQGEMNREQNDEDDHSSINSFGSSPMSYFDEDRIFELLGSDPAHGQE